MNTTNTARKIRQVEVTEKDLPLHCPSDQSSDWAEHPRVFLPLDKTNEVVCPYCGTTYKKVS